MSDLSLDAEALYLELRDGVRRLLDPDVKLLGIWSGGAWLSERLAADLGRDRPGVITSTLHRDDYGERGIGRSGGVTRIPFQVGGARILLVDDVLYTGRTIRAVLNELFDFGRPAAVTLAVLVDRGGRQLPIDAAFAAAKVTLPPTQRLRLARGEGGRFTFSIDR
jgi:pyrimidine operon attenuation protein/uracil phosphoribosyltransferase